MIVVDSRNEIHVFWYDVFSGYKYVMGDGNSWGAPVPVTLPFNETAIKKSFIADSQGRVFAFWIDSRNNFFFSNASANSLLNRGSWIDPISINRNVVGYTARIDERDTVHVTYVVGVDAIDAPSGIYYQQAQAGGNLSKIIPIDQSPYYRRLRSTGELPQGETGIDLSPISTDVETFSQGSQTNVVVAWTNPTLKRLYIRKSADGGATWGGASEITGPDKSPMNMTPQSVYLRANHDQMVLFWEIGQSNSCSNFYQTSMDRGTTWGISATFLPQINSCSSEIYFFNGDESSIDLFASIDQSSYLTKWDGTEWSEASLLSDIASFPNPDLKSNVDFRDRQFIASGDRVYVIGSDQGEGRDVWIMSSDLASLNPNSPVRKVWSKPTVVATMDLAFANPILLADGNNKLHAFWYQAYAEKPQGSGVAIHHASWKESGGASPSLILRSPTGKTDQESVILDSEGNFLAVWSGGQSGETYFSSAPADQADGASNWFDPVHLPLAGIASANPVVVSSPDGAISVAYAAPINENRGIYFTKSLDSGKTWTDPVKVFDAVNNGCEMVDQADLAATASGTLHLTWRCNTLPGGIGPLSLWYSKLTDDGMTWKSAVTLTERSIEWSKIASTGGTDLHLIWKETSNGQTGLWEMVSHDDGETWGNPANITTSNPDQGPVALTTDPAGQIYLVQALTGGTNLSIQYWKWDGKSWFSGETRNLDGIGLSQIESASATIIADGHLAVILVGKNDPLKISGKNGLYYLSIPVDIPEREPVALNTIRPTSTVAPATPTPTVLTTPTSQPTLIAGIANQAPGNGSSSSNQLIMVLGVVTGISLVVVVGVIVYDRRYRRRNLS